MIEDKQVYTTAKSAELERKVKKIYHEFLQALKKFKSKTDQEINKGKEKIFKTIEENTKAPDQNIRIETSSKPVKFQTEYTRVEKNEGLKLPPEKLQFAVAVTLFLLIIIVIAVGIYLPLATR